MGFERSGWDWQQVSPHVDINEVEWVTDVRKSILHYGILIRCYPGQTPPSEYFRSPVDRGRF